MTNVIRNTTWRGPTGETLRRSRDAEEGARGRGEQEGGGAGRREGGRGGERDGGREEGEEGAEEGGREGGGEEGGEMRGQRRGGNPSRKGFITRSLRKGQSGDKRRRQAGMASDRGLIERQGIAETLATWLTSVANS